MTNIRRHGFESDAQWREYLDEIDGAMPEQQSLPDERASIATDLADIRARIDDLQERAHALVSRRRVPVSWPLLVAGSVVAIFARRMFARST